LLHQHYRAATAGGCYGRGTPAQTLGKECALLAGECARHDATALQQVRVFPYRFLGARAARMALMDDRKLETEQPSTEEAAEADAVPARLDRRDELIRELNAALARALAELRLDRAA
jgi:hypothetical protein